MELVMHINNVKSIRDFTFKFPLEKGLYAITGENASGKSTLVACASTVFFMMPMYDYFGRPDGDAYIEFTLGTSVRGWHYHNKQWLQKTSTQKMALNGFYEGSIIFGNRFKDTSFSVIRILDRLSSSDMGCADEFIRTNLGVILHDDPNHYEKLLVIKKEVAREKGLFGEPYFYELPQNRYISQARMSTGENLLISILHSLNIVRKKRITHNEGRPCIVFLDEIELALHASSLRRLVHFLQRISDDLDLSIFFSTHSLELIRGIKPQNIYYLTKQIDGSISITNPCYPAFATRNLYSDDGYGNDVVIFVEDEVAKCIVERILLEKDILHNIRVKVLPTGGWTNTITMAHDVISSRLLLKDTKLVLILDKDIKDEVPKFMANHKQYKYLSPDYLPISSLEKYLKAKLVNKVDSQLYKQLDNYLFQGRPLSSALRKYQVETNIHDDLDGKTLYGYLINELRSIRKDREDLAEIVVIYLMETDKNLVDTLANYLRKKIEDGLS
ncbi:ATP-dependent nuclease [Desulfosporosinus youngiae]|uniref:AAA+ ATPase domain-containing protein n=1 Tax=Desulfosporosinus youngiae DSM 17734 TaxID=768710 RepID=H5Y2K7_9FIRM|nr:AAA family ATPase [Desulfosporosinus youngiae]EHQ88698.1 hypothetical protein DesyoDRAFT_1560 [Desulfosporosinus youngiae DSM 17734]